MCMRNLDGCGRLTWCSWTGPHLAPRCGGAATLPGLARHQVCQNPVSQPQQEQICVNVSNATIRLVDDGSLVLRVRQAGEKPSWLLPPPASRSPSICPNPWSRTSGALLYCVLRRREKMRNYISVVFRCCADYYLAKPGAGIGTHCALNINI